jgi:diaminohydroxyphosphoribosylaminopyrimidine deaminase/5-amino-6-(5-phosphoribosylamino)uracil reductase
LHDEDYMKLALKLARRGLGRTSPNPMVGAVIVRDGRIIGQGYHHYFGGRHAEVDAIEGATGNVSGATLYVTLEPCRHHGKTPPCVEAIIKHKIGRVVIGTLDPNPDMRGRSVSLMKEQGIETKVGVLEDECRALNEAHFKLMETGLPLVTLKFAQTLDGRIAAATGSSKWLSSPPALRLAHRLRSRSDAVMVGVGTVLADDPELTVRLVKGRSPTRIILDSKLRLPLDAKVLTDQKTAPTIIATTPAANDEKLAALREKGIEVLVVAAETPGRIDLARLLRTLGERSISSVLVEGGSETITSLLARRLADRFVAIVAPKIMGRGIETVGELGVNDVDEAVKLTFTRTYRVGGDLVVEGRII